MVAEGEGWLVEGKTHLDDLNDQIGSAFDSDEFDTVGGFVFGQFGRQPKPDETLDLDGFRFLVMETDGRRILRLRVEKAEIEADDVDLLDAQ
jgi:CBS domain containing-hemolysin-like protein